MVERKLADVSVKALADEFRDYIINTDIDVLKKTFMNDVVDNDTDNSIGKFRLMYIFNGSNEYTTFFVNFYAEEDKKKLKVWNMQKNESIIECTFNDNLKSWADDINSYASSITTNMATKLKSILT